MQRCFPELCVCVVILMLAGKTLITQLWSVDKESHTLARLHTLC